MADPSPQDFIKMRMWYGKWALRYSMLQLLLGVFAVVVSGDSPNPVLVVLMLLNAIWSHLHLWGVVRANLIAYGETWRVKFRFYFVLLLYSIPISLTLFPDSLDTKGAVKLFAILFLAPPGIMLETYLNLKKGGGE